ncbi:MAG: DUF1150 domain-containing protein [Rhodospirillaceae bacterium]|jgi:hypothetical protein|nr:DUF1150 domain-containing protein [Rhodospirillaceae bacterium]
MSAKNLTLLGLQDVVYIKRVVINDEVFWSIHSADGTNIGIAPGRDLAFAAVSQNNLEPVSVH